MTAPRPLALIAFAQIALVLTVAGCGPRTHTSAISAESHAPGTTLATTAANCAAYPVGAAGVIRTHCSGRATVLVTIGAVSHPLRGGDCSSPNGLFHLDLGVVSGPDLAGPKPDEFSLTAPAASGPFTGARLTITVGGKTYRVSPNSGELTATGGSFQGVARGGRAIKGSFTC